jgi:hypothetical protein
MIKVTRTSLLLLSLVVTATDSCGPGSSAPELFTALTAISEAMKGVHNVIQHADEVTRDRLADADSRMARSINEIDDLMKRHEDRTSQIANDLLDKTFRAASDALFTASLEVQDAGLDFELKVNNAILNAAHVLSGVPFVRVEPFVAMIYPLNLLPGSQDDYNIEVLGFFRPEWGDHTFTLPDGQVVKAAIGANNRLSVTLQKDLVQQYAGRRITIKFQYPIKKHEIGQPREIWLHVLPDSMLAYRINAAALPDTVYDYPQVKKTENANADPGQEYDREPVWGLNDLTGSYDFINVYDRSQSSIDSAVIAPGDIQGNNPTGDNSATLKESAGQRVVLSLHAHGKPAKGLEGGKGANVTTTVTITLKLARRSSAVQWHFKNGEKEEGELGWGGNKELFPDKEKPLQSLILDLTDFSFDPPQHRTLALGERYQSRFTDVTTGPGRISMIVRSFERH